MIPKLTDEPGALATAAAIRAGALSPLEAVDAAIARIEALDGPINAVVVRDFGRARAAAQALDGTVATADQPLFGVPMTIKEAFNIAGLPTTWGLEQFRDYVPERDADVVARLKRAGAIFLGKTNVPPYLLDWQSANPIYGRTNNPHDLARTAGGSSGGSAAALATGMVAAEYGSDIGGSIRVPAHFCGVWGHKPTYGAVSAYGHNYPGTSGHDVALNVVGPLARTPADLALLLELTLERPQSLSGKPLGECRFLLLTEHPVLPTDSGVIAALEAAGEAIAKAGARVERTSALLPDLAAQHMAYFPLLNATADPLALLFGGTPATVPQWFAWLDAQAGFQRAWAALFESYDFVLAPPYATPAFPHHDKGPFERTLAINGTDYPAAGALNWPGVATLPGLPSTVLPVGSADGLPCGMQVIGARWRDRECIAAAARIGELLGA